MERYVSQRDAQATFLFSSQTTEYENTTASFFLSSERERGRGRERGGREGEREGGREGEREREGGGEREGGREVG